MRFFAGFVDSAEFTPKLHSNKGIVGKSTLRSVRLCVVSPFSVCRRHR